jgi:predicted ArsR family transcriptional regulator
MNPSPPVVGVEGDEATVEAGHLAAKLGLSVDRLRAAMRRGIVFGTVERGVGEGAGRPRLTFRCRARSGTVAVEADGTLKKAPASGR